MDMSMELKKAQARAEVAADIFEAIAKLRETLENSLGYAGKQLESDPDDSYYKETSKKYELKIEVFDSVLADILNMEVQK